MKDLFKKYAFSVLFLISTTGLFAQVLPVGTPVLEDYYRRLQLLGELDSTISFSVRPLSNAVLNQEDIFHPEIKEKRTNNQLFNTAHTRFVVKLMPLEWKNQFASSMPYGWNDAGMIPAKGFQTYLSAGVYAEYKFLSVQLRPEFVYAQNSDFDSYLGRSENDWQLWWQGYANKIDLPEKFGSGAYTKMLPGQSSVRLNFNPISLGISTENLWWGPGMRNSLLMSNTAPGFLHATFNSTRPVKTAVGSFEWQLVAGRLDASGYTPKVLTDNDYHEQYYEPKPDDWRYFSGLVLSYQPKWVPGLSVGLINVFTVNSKDMGNKLGDYIPFFSSGSTTDMIDSDNPIYESDLAAQDRNLSVFARWVVPSVQFEIYGEYARNDRSWDVRDLIVSPNHSRSYMFGVRKLVYLPGLTKDLLQINAEVTQLEPPKTEILRSTPPMYQHQVVRNGYTHLGQLLGAGVGFGNNIQSLGVSWIRGFKQLGFQLERIVHNNDFLYRSRTDPRANWVDLGLGALGTWDYGKFYFSGQLQYIRARNYQYRVEENLTTPSYWNFRKQDKSNLLFQIGAYYRL